MKLHKVSQGLATAFCYLLSSILPALQSNGKLYHETSADCAIKLPRAYRNRHNHSKRRQNDFQSGKAWSLRSEISSGKSSDICYFLKKMGVASASPPPEFRHPDQAVMLGVWSMVDGRKQLLISNLRPYGNHV